MPDRDRPSLVEVIQARHIPGWFAAHRDDVSPQTVFRRKAAGRISPEPAQDFVDAGLLPAVEQEIGRRLTTRVTRAVDELCKLFPESLNLLTPGERRWIYESTFYLLAGKLLRDKVKEFSQLDLDNIDEVFKRVALHYGAQRPPGIGDLRRREALGRAMRHFSEFRYLGNITTDTLADVYEDALIDEEKRKALGTHSTPSYIVDYMVWKLAPWIEAIDPPDRHVLEPACGHAPFLTSAMRLLRFMLPTETSHQEAHVYLRDHLHGIEKDGRAREVGRLSLSLADIPNPDSWDLQAMDMFKPGVLESASARASILLCNPPFERFTPVQKLRYRAVHPTKPEELLHRTLPHLPEGAAIGLVIPQAILHRKKDITVELRRLLTTHFQLSEICLLNDHFFRHADHETALVLGRKATSKALVLNHFRYRLVRDDGTKKFKESYAATSEFDASQADVAASPGRRLWLPDLPSVWKRCAGLSRLAEIADVGLGVIYKGLKELDPNTFTYGETHAKLPPGLPLGFAERDAKARIDRVPTTCRMNLSSDALKMRRAGATIGIKQIVLTYIRTGRGPWRWRGFIDRVGRPFESRYMSVRPTVPKIPLEYLWALLNSPFAHAYLHCHTMKRQNLKGVVEDLPMPEADPDAVLHVVELVQEYFAECSKVLSEEAAGALFEAPKHVEVMSRERVRNLLAVVDAEILKLYELPPAQERELLDLFTDHKRPGLPPKVNFTRYFPPGFDRLVPLYLYLSDAYARRRLAGPKDFASDDELNRLRDLQATARRRALSSTERRELDRLRLLLDADAFVTAGNSPAEFAVAVEKANQATRLRSAQLADAIIGGQLKGEGRGRKP